MKSRNLTAQMLDITSGDADAEFAVEHKMENVIPLGFLVCRRGSSASLYLGTTPWTMKYAYLKSSVAAATYTVLFFV